MNPSLEALLDEAVNFEAEAFDEDQEISGADLVEWFAEWRCRARRVVKSTSPPRNDLIHWQRLRKHLHSVLEAFDAEADKLLHALSHGGIQVVVGEVTVLLFRRPSEASSSLIASHGNLDEGGV